MTNEQVMAKLMEIYSDVQYSDAELRHVEADVFCVRANGNMTLYRVNDGDLEQRVDVDEHTCRWDVMV